VAELLTIRPPAPLEIPTSARGSYVAKFLRVGESLTWNGYALFTVFSFPQGVESLFAFGGEVGQYLIVATRTDRGAGYYLNTLDGVARTFRVDSPLTQGSWPADPGEAAVGRWKRDARSDTGWAFDSWRTEEWNWTPEGFLFVAAATGQTVALDLVLARSRPDGAIIGVVYGPINQPPLPIPPCPLGYQWNPLTERCEPIVIEPPPPPPPIGDGDGDELTLAVALILRAINDLAALIAQQGGGDGAQGDCCNRVVLAISTVTAELGKVATAVSSLAGRGGGGDTTVNIDLTPLVTKVDELVRAFIDPQAPVVQGQQALIDCVCKWLEQISGALATTRDGKPVSVGDALADLAASQHVRPFVIDELVKSGIITAELAQQLGDKYGVEEIILILNGFVRFLYRSEETNIIRFVEWLQDVLKDTVRISLEVVTGLTIPPNIGAIDLFKAVVQTIVVAPTKLTAILEPLIPEIAEAWAPAIPAFLKLSEQVFGRAAAGAVNDLLAPLLSLKEVSPDEIPDVMQKVLGTAFGGAMMAKAVASLFHFIPWLNTTGLQQFAGIFGELAGFAIVINSVLSPEIDATLGTAGRRRANITHRPHEPGLRDGQTWFARNLIEEDAVHQIAALNGLPTQWEAAYRDSSYRRLSVLQIARLVQDVEFDPEEIRKELRSAGYSQQSIDRLLPILIRNSERAYKQSIISELVALAAEGLMNPAELDRQLEAL
jgi:hypothetical protein